MSGTVSDPGPTVSVAVVVKDRRDLMGACLAGIAAQDLDAPFELVVVDNGSTDGTVEVVEAFAADGSVPTTVVVDGGSLGAIRNRAVQLASAPVVAFVDSDCVPAPDWLRHGLAVLDADADGSVGVVQGRTVPDPASPQGRWSATQDLPAFTGRYEACNIFYRRDPLVAAGGFDEAIGFFGEDTAAGLAVVRRGHRAAFAPDAVVAHVVTHPGLGWHLRRGLGYGNWASLARRHPEVRDLFWHRWFLRADSAACAAAVAAAVVAALGRRPVALAGAAPYAWRRRPAALDRAALVDAAGAVAFDLAVLVGLVRGSIRERTLVL